MRLPEIKPHKKYRYDEIIEALARSARLHGAKVLAAQMGVDERYLQSKLTVSQSSSAHYLRADEMISIMLITGDLTPLHMILDLFDLVPVPRTIEPGEKAQAERLLAVSGKAGRAIMIISEVLADGRVTPEEHQAVVEALKDLEPEVATAIAD